MQCGVAAGPVAHDHQRGAVIAQPRAQPLDLARGRALGRAEHDRGEHFAEHAGDAQRMAAWVGHQHEAVERQAELGDRLGSEFGQADGAAPGAARRYPEQQCERELHRAVDRSGSALAQGAAGQQRAQLWSRRKPALVQPQRLHLGDALLQRTDGGELIHASNIRTNFRISQVEMEAWERLSGSL